MKWLRCDGRELILRDVGDPPLAVYVPGTPGGTLKHVDELMDDENARGYLRKLLDSGAAVKKRA